MYRAVEFPSQGATLRGRLYVRPDSSPAPLVIMAHGFSATVTGMVADAFAAVFHEAGLAVLLYDHRGFGLSDGPRQEINLWIQARGYRDAIDYAARLPEIDASRIALWGDSASAGEVIGVAAFDSRVRAIVGQIPACGRVPPPEDSRGALLEAIRRAFLDGDVETAERTVGPLPVVSSDQRGTPSLLTPLTAFRWFIEFGARHGTGWQNWATIAIPRTEVSWQPVLCAPAVQAAALLLIAPDDEMPGAEPEMALLAFERLGGSKELVEIDGGHFGLLYHPGPIFDTASSAQRAFLVRHLM